MRFAIGGFATAVFATGPVGRQWGVDRYATAASVSAAAFPDGAPVAFVATGERWFGSLFGMDAPAVAV